MRLFGESRLSFGPRLCGGVDLDIDEMQVNAEATMTRKQAF